VPWLQRIRFGLHIVRSRYRSQWRWLDQIPAKPWLIECIGQRAYQVIWHPLLKVKFGDYYDKISAAWIWHRIWRVASSRRSMFDPEVFGCLEYGTATLVDPLVDWLRAQPNVEVPTGVRVRPIEVRDERVTEVHAGDQCIPCDAVISTVALPVLDRLVPNQSDSYFERARQVKYIAVVCMLLRLKRPFSPQLLDQHQRSAHRVQRHHRAEQPEPEPATGRPQRRLRALLPAHHRAPLQRRQKDLFTEYVAMLRHMNPDFSENWVKEYHVSRTPYAQPIFTTNFVDLTPSHRTPIRGFYVTDSTQFYPEDRTISQAIRRGRSVAGMIMADFATPAS
jgi:protoporphyrinogen oxidase